MINTINLLACTLIASTSDHLHTIQATKDIKLRSNGKATQVYRCPAKTQHKQSSCLQIDNTRPLREFKPCKGGK